jgi:hypothetical protein
MRSRPARACSRPRNWVGRNWSTPCDIVLIAGTFSARGGQEVSGQRIFNVFIQSAYFVGVESFLVHLEERPQERAGREHLNRVADCFPRCGKSLVRHGSYHPRLVSAEQLRGGAIVKTGHFTLQSACLAARQHIEDLTGRGSPERKREDGRTSGLTSSISWWFPMTEPCGIDVLLGLDMGVRVNFHKEKPVIHLELCGSNSENSKANSRNQ